VSSPVSDREQRILGIIETARGKRAKFRDERITMAHGAGGKATGRLIEGLLAPAFGIETLDDAATVGDMAITTDAFVVKPLTFPGGSIGELAVNGTVNDLAMSGARPLALTVSLILEEGLEATTLRAEVDAIARAARQADVRIVGGDTKVVERGHADGMYITTTGLGRRDPRAQFNAARPGDRIMLSGPIAAHGTAIMLARGEFDLESDDISSDTRSLWPAVDAILGRGVRALRDATRGGVASVLNELARASGVAMLIQEAAVPVAPAVAGACELLGIDPMYVANEGVFIAIVEPGCAVPGFADIGEVKTEPPGRVLVATSFGGKRVMDELVGDPLPRIC
jgi:hydrogenase expression/formation protein HypE